MKLDFKVAFPKENKQSVPMNGLCVSCVLGYRVEVKEEKDTKVVLSKGV